MKYTFEYSIEYTFEYAIEYIIKDTFEYNIEYTIEYPIEYYFVLFQLVVFFCSYLIFSLTPPYFVYCNKIYFEKKVHGINHKLDNGRRMHSDRWYKRRL